MSRMPEIIKNSNEIVVQQNYQILVNEFKNNITLSKDEKVEIIKDLNRMFGQVVPEIPMENFINDVINEEEKEEEETRTLSPFFQYEKTFRDNPLSLPKRG